MNPNVFTNTKVKYVILDTNEVRICSMDDVHKEQVKPGENAVSAGFLKVDNRNNKIRFRICIGMDSWSSSLKLGPNPKIDGPLIEKSVPTSQYCGTWED